MDDESFTVGGVTTAFRKRYRVQGYRVQGGPLDPKLANRMDRVDFFSQTIVA